MGKALSYLPRLTTVGIFLFVGILYFAVFASQQKSWAIACQTGPDGTFASWCATTDGACITTSGTDPHREGAAQKCTDACNSCRQCPCPAPPNTPTCSSFGGTCYRRFSCAPTYVSLSGGDAHCERFGPVYSCCRPLNACERASGTCVSASSQGTAPCPAGKHYDTSLSCSSLYQVCCAPNQPQPPIPPPPPQAPAPRYDITGVVYEDNNLNKRRDCNGACNNGTGDEKGKTGIVTTLRGSGTNRDQRTNATGNYAFNNFPQGTYTISITSPSGYKPTTTTPLTVNLTANRPGINFGIAPTYTISGNIFIDDNSPTAGNGLKDNGELNYTGGGIAMGLRGGPTTGTISVNQGAGTYSISNIFAGTYIVSSTTLPSGYRLIAPTNAAFSVTVGPACSVVDNDQTGAICVGNNIQNLNFAISTHDSWMQTYGLDVRIDEGYTNNIPQAPSYPSYASVVGD